MRTCTCALLLLSLLACGCSALPGRKTVQLDQDWKFIREDVAGASDVTFDDSHWQRVDLPHTWNATDGAGGPQRIYRGPGWYRKHINLPADQLRNKVVCLWFGAAGSAAEVFVNGQSTGTHMGAFGAFCFDVTDKVRAGDNVIAVRATNARDPQIAPLSGDFNVCGGLYRDARLLLLDPISISTLDSASSGVYVEQTNVSDFSATLGVTTLVRNTQSTEQAGQVKTTLLDRDGREVASLSSDQKFAAHDTKRVNQMLKIANPHLWNGRPDPYLYTLRVQVDSDEVSVPIGLRSFNVDPQQGFILNGKPYDLHGVARHQEMAGKAWQITPADMQADIDVLRANRREE